MTTINRNVRGGKNYKKMKTGLGKVGRKSKNPNTPVDTSTGIDYYGIVLNRLGDNRLKVKLDTGNEIQAVIPGRFRRKIWFNAGDYVQVQLVGDNFYDIIQKIINENELAKAQTVISKKENTLDDVFIPNIDDEYIDDSDPDSDQDFDAFGNKTDKIDKIDKSDKSDKTDKTDKIEKVSRKQNEKKRDLLRRNNNRNHDFKPDSIIEGSGSESGSESE